MCKYKIKRLYMTVIQRDKLAYSRTNHKNLITVVAVLRFDLSPQTLFLTLKREEQKWNSSRERINTQSGYYNATGVLTCSLTVLACSGDGDMQLRTWLGKSSCELWSVPEVLHCDSLLRHLSAGRKSEPVKHHLDVGFTAVSILKLLSGADWKSGEIIITSSKSDY